MRWQAKLLGFALYCENLYMLDTIKYKFQNKGPHFSHPNETKRACIFGSRKMRQNPVEAANKLPCKAVYPL